VGASWSKASSGARLAERAPRLADHPCFAGRTAPDPPRLAEERKGRVARPCGSFLAEERGRRRMGSQEGGRPPAHRRRCGWVGGGNEGGRENG
jgi:hypothetical protein